MNSYIMSPPRHSAIARIPTQPITGGNYFPLMANFTGKGLESGMRKVEYGGGRYNDLGLRIGDCFDLGLKALGAEGREHSVRFI